MTTPPDCDPKLLRAVYKLPPILCEVLDALVALPLVTQEEIVARTRSRSKKDGLKVTIFRLRKALEPYGINIYSGTSVGYWLEPADKAKVLQHLAALDADDTQDQEAA